MESLDMKREANFYKRIEAVSGNYPRGKYSSSRLFLYAGLHHKLGLTFNNADWDLMGDWINSQIQNDFQNCALPALDTILNVGYGAALKNTEQYDIFFDENYYELSSGIFCKSEAELLSKLARENLTYAKRFLSSGTKTAIEDVKSRKINLLSIASHPIKLAYISRNNIAEHIDFNNGKFPINSIMIRVKSLQSSVIKEMERFRRIYAPTNEELLALSANSQNPVSKEELKYFYESWIFELLDLGVDIFDAYDAFKPSTYSNSWKYKSSKLNELFGDPNISDFAGTSISTNDSQKDLNKLMGVIDHRLGRKFSQLPHKRESPQNDDMKDGSHIRGITSTRAAEHAELRIKTFPGILKSAFGDSDLGIDPHYLYRDSGIRGTLIPALDAGNDDLEQILNNYLSLSKLSYEELFLL